MSEHTATSPFTVLVVCTGNICRSPLAEQLIEARFTQAGIAAVVHSAGTRALVAHAMTPEAASLSQQYGGDPAYHAARQLTSDLVAGADLVLTATREQRSEVVSLHPRASRYAYTLPQFARVLSAMLAEERPGESTTAHDPAAAETLRSILVDVAASRGLAPPPGHPDDDDIVDPYRRSQTVYDEAGRIIDRTVTEITSGLSAALGRV